MEESYDSKSYDSRLYDSRLIYRFPRKEKRWRKRALTRKPGDVQGTKDEKVRGDVESGRRSAAESD